MLIDAPGVALRLSMVAAALVVAAEGIAIWRVIPGPGAITHIGQLRSTEQGKLSHDTIFPADHSPMSAMNHAKIKIVPSGGDGARQPGTRSVS